MIQFAAHLHSSPVARVNPNVRIYSIPPPPSPAFSAAARRAGRRKTSSLILNILSAIEEGLIDEEDVRHPGLTVHQVEQIARQARRVAKVGLRGSPTGQRQLSENHCFLWPITVNEDSLARMDEARRPVQSPCGRSVPGGGVDHGLMSFDGLSRSASYQCEGKGDENESLFHGHIPSLPSSACPGLGGWAVTEITGILISDEAFYVRPGPPPGLPFWAHGGALRQAAGVVQQPASCR